MVDWVQVYVWLLDLRTFVAVRIYCLGLMMVLLSLLTTILRVICEVGMKTKLEMAHDWIMKFGDKEYPNLTLERAWEYADAMQTEADKRLAEAEYKEEWQPDWSQAPDWAKWWVIGSLTKQGIWSEAKPNSVKINGVDYWEVTSPSGDEHLSVAPSFNYQGDWRDSLRKRPN